MVSVPDRSQHDPEGITDSSWGVEAQRRRPVPEQTTPSHPEGMPANGDRLWHPVRMQSLRAVIRGSALRFDPRLLSAIASRWNALTIGPLLLLLSGCVSTGYDYGSAAITHNDLPLRDNESQIERGRPIPILDGAGWVVGIPSKVMLLSTRVDNHSVSHETEESLQEYLDANGLDRVKVRLNQYAPLDEWRRLHGNKSVGPGWRYTLGTLATLGYTVLPGRLLGGDHYNPFTNTINLYSDHPAIALHEAGHAKDFSRRTYKGTWAAAYLLPGIALGHEEIATSDILSYLASEGRTDEQAAAYRILYPAYGSHIAGQINNLVPSPSSLAVTAACVVPGHVVGRWKASRVAPTRSGVEPSVPDDQTSSPGIVRLISAEPADQRSMTVPAGGFTEK